MNLFDLVTAQAITTYWTESASNSIAYLGSAYFPARKQSGLDLSWILGYNGTAVALKPSTFDAKAPLRDRIGVKRVETEMPFFREGMTIREKERQQLLSLANSPETFWGPVIQRIYDDRANLVNGALVQPERMIWQLLTRARITISANNVLYDYNYDPTGEYEANNVLDFTANPWSNPATSTPITDMQAAIQDLEDLSGTRPATAVMSRQTWSWLLASNQIKLDLNVTAGQNIILTDTDLQAYIVRKLGINVIVYNKKYRDESKNQKSFMPDGVVCLLPSGTLGNTWFGTTPEEADLMVPNAPAEVSIVNTGVAVTSIIIPHPVNVQTIVSEIVLPSYERMNETAILQVA